MPSNHTSMQGPRSRTSRGQAEAAAKAKAQARRGKLSGSRRRTSRTNGANGMNGPAANRRRSVEAKRRQHQDDVNPRSIIMGLALAASLLYLFLSAMLGWPPFTPDPPLPPKTTMFLIDISDGTTKDTPRPVARIVREMMDTPRDRILVAQIENNHDDPTRTIAEFVVKETKKTIDNDEDTPGVFREQKCEDIYNSRTTREAPARDWPIVLGLKGDHGWERAWDACKVEANIQQEVEDGIYLPPTGELRISPLVAAIEGAETILDREEPDPELRAIRVYSDMVQHNPAWFSMIPGYKKSVHFREWDSKSVLRDRRLDAAQFLGREVKIATKDVTVHLVPRPKIIRGDLHKLKLKGFWENFLRNPGIQWIDEKAEKPPGTRGPR